MDPEYQHHIRHTHADLENQSWCGKPLSRSDWAFQSIDHAIYAIKQGTLREPCPDCLRAISEVMQVTDENLRAFKRGYAAGSKSCSLTENSQQPTDKEIDDWEQKCINRCNAGDSSFFWIFDTVNADMKQVVRAVLANF